jgi:uncharacterized membrane protein (UPF0127 family)
MSGGWLAARRGAFRRWAAALSMAFAALAGAEENAAAPKFALEIGSAKLEVEVANTPDARERGMMNRTNLGADSGMLFVLDTPDNVCLWMKNTKIPLSAAFINSYGWIMKIVDLQPDTLDEHCAPFPIKYVLEVNRDWFASNRIKAGDRVDKLPPAP